MASIISAGTTSGTALNISGDTTGNLAFTTQAGANTITIANQTGTLNAAGPTFSAYQSTLQSVSNATFTKILFQTELWDTNNNFASSTFTPTVAGYYQINGAVQFAGVIAGIQVLAIYKNNSVFVRGPLLSTGTSYGSAISGLVYANGTTDYFELFAYQGGGVASNTDPTSATSWFQATLVRGA